MDLAVEGKGCGTMEGNKTMKRVKTDLALQRLSRNLLNQKKKTTNIYGQEDTQSNTCSVKG